jgi:hypothetical protein
MGKGTSSGAVNERSTRNGRSLQDHSIATIVAGAEKAVQTAQARAEAKAKAPNAEEEALGAVAEIFASPEQPKPKTHGAQSDSSGCCESPDNLCLPKES